MMDVTHIPNIHPAPLHGWEQLVHRVVFYPVLYTQGPFVKSRTLRLPEPEGPRAGVIGSGPDLRLLIAGDSSAAGVGVDHQDQALSGQLADRLKGRFRLHWRLVARGGNTTAMTLAQIKAASPAAADIAVIGLGVNDITWGTPLHVWLKHKADLLDHLTGKLGVRHVYVSGLPPLSQFPALPNPLRWTLGHQAERFDSALRDMLAARHDCTWITLDMSLTADNMAADGYHPGPQVYAAWADAIAAHIRADRRH